SSVLLIGVLLSFVGVLLLIILIFLIVVVVLLLVIVVLLLVVVVLLFGWLVQLVWLGLLIVQPKVDEDVRDVVLQSGGQPPALLSELCVVCHRVQHLLLLCT